MLRRLYDEATEHEDVMGLTIGTRPDCVSDAILDLIESYGKGMVVWVEYGLQTANDETLQRINRGHGVADFIDADEEQGERAEKHSNGADARGYLSGQTLQGERSANIGPKVRWVEGKRQRTKGRGQRKNMRDSFLSGWAGSFALSPLPSAV